MKASELAIKIIEQISIRGDFRVHPTATLSNIFYDGRPQNLDYLDLEQVKELTHLSRSTIYLYMEKNIFPRPVKMGRRIARWKAQEIDKWLLTRKKIILHKNSDG